MKLSPEATQRLFIIWFSLLTVMVVYNFYTNLTDTSALSRSYEENRSRYEASMAEHEDFRQRLSYLEGRVACSTPSSNQEQLP